MINDTANKKRVAIACQGGGSHTDLTAGVLKGLLRSGRLQENEVVALSGTSGDAVCALLAWHNLLGGAAAGAVKDLDAFWRDNSATAPYERIMNNWVLWENNLQNFVATPMVSPYHNPFATVGIEEFEAMLERRVDFRKVVVQPEDSRPVLLVGAAEVLSGQFKAFHSRRDRISARTILASAAIPTLFRSVRLEGGTYWDGLFSQNPPVKELTDERPDEIWVIQRNPRVTEHEPKTTAEIADRRNELAGNLSSYQKLDFIEKIDQMLEEGLLPRDGKYRQIVVRVIELSRSRLSRSLGTASKLNRDPGFIRDLISHGEVRAGEFLTALASEEAWRSRDHDAVMAFFADDSTLASSAPLPAGGRYANRTQIRSFVTEHLTREIRVDPTRKQIAQNGVTWKVRAPAGDGLANRVEGVAEAVFRGGKIESLRLGAGT
jgi:NTE family protein